MKKRTEALVQTWRAAERAVSAAARDFRETTRRRDLARAQLLAALSADEARKGGR